MRKSAIMTGIGIANSMIGSSMIIFPLKFDMYGIPESTIFVLIMSALMTLTCKLIVDQIKPHQTQLAQSIRGKLGPNFFRAFGLLSASTVFLVASIYFLLASDIFYDVFEEILGPISLDKKIFKIIMLIFFGVPIFFKDLKLVLKMSPLALGALVISSLTILSSVPMNMHNVTPQTFAFKTNNMKDILTLAGLMGFAFISHPSISPIIKQNGDQSSNSKAVYIGYAITSILYLIVGILGSLAICGKTPSKRNNVMDFFIGSWQAPVIGCLNFLYFFLILPIFTHVSKTQILELVPARFKESPEKVWIYSSIIYSITWITLNIIFIITETSPEAVMTFIGAVMCYYITYFLPIYMTIRLGNYRINSDKQLTDLLTSSGDNIPSLINETPKEGREDPILLWKKIIYFVVLSYGTVLLVSQFVQFFM